jgi:RimJ/RimL family protein N-acetyltransferase
MPESPVAGHVELREARDADLPVFFEQQLDPEATAMAAFPARDREAFMAHWTKILADPAVLIRTVVADGDVAGNVVSWRQDGERDVGYWIGKPFWGRGIATRALAAFLRELTERPLHAHVARHNVASRRVLVKCGFVEAGEDGDELVLRLDAEAAPGAESSVPSEIGRRGGHGPMNWPTEMVSPNRNNPHPRTRFAWLELRRTCQRWCPVGRRAESDDLSECNSR